MTKEEEESYASIFLSKYFPDDDITYEVKESPDFDLFVFDRRIGFEVTESLSDETADRTNFTHKIGTEIVSQLESLGLGGFILSLNIADPINLRGQIKSDFISEVSKFIYKECTSHLTESVVSCDIVGGFIEGFNGFTLNFISDLDKSEYQNVGARFTPNFSIDDLTNVVTKKEELLKKYRKCDEYWLLIVINKTYEGAINKLNIPKCIPSKFQKVFLLDATSKKINEINIA